MPRLPLAAGLLLLGACAGAAPAPLVPVPRRITDEALAHDDSLLRALDARLRAAADTSVAAARGRALLGFARWQLDGAHRGPAADLAVREAAAIAAALERGAALPVATGALREPAAAFSPSLWARAERLLEGGRTRCGAAGAARAQALLLVAAEEQRLRGETCAAPFAARALALIERAEGEQLACRAAWLAAAVVEPAPALVLAERAPPSAPPPERAVALAVAARAPRNLHFALDRADLGAASRRVLDRVLAALAPLPDVAVVLEAHTDPRGSAAYNRRLAERRAASVRRYLEARGFAAERLFVEVYGKARPLDEGTGYRERMARARRVELRFVAGDGTLIETDRQAEDLQLEPPGAPRR